MDAQQHGAAHRRARWWALAVRVNDDGPLTLEQDLALQQRNHDFLSLLVRVQMRPVELSAVLMA